VKSKNKYVKKRKNDIIKKLHKDNKDQHISPLKKGGPVSLCSNMDLLDRPFLGSHEKNTTNESETVVSIAEYRDILDDYVSPENLVIQRLQYIEAWCTNIISDGLEKYVKENRKNK
jgi:hypothetical protein